MCGVGLLPTYKDNCDVGVGVGEENLCVIDNMNTRFWNARLGEPLWELRSAIV